MQFFLPVEQDLLLYSFIRKDLGEPGFNGWRIFQGVAVIYPALLIEQPDPAIGVDDDDRDVGVVDEAGKDPFLFL